MLSRVGFAPWTFLDDVGQTWALRMSAAGQLTFTQIANPPAPNASPFVPLKDLVTGNTVKLVVVFTTFPTLTPVLSSGPTLNPNYIPLTRPGVGTYLLQVANGAIVANPLGDGPGPPDPIVGQLFNQDMVNPPVNPPNLPGAGGVSEGPGGWLPPYSQPGGIGTQALPAQQSGSSSNITGVPLEVGNGMNTSPCGHWFNNFEITFSTAGEEQVAIVRCPLCGYVVQIVFPAALIYDQSYEHISS